MNFGKKMMPIFQKNSKILLILGLILIIGLGLAFGLKPDKKMTNSGQQVAILIENVRNFYKNKPSAWGLNSFSAVENKIVPQNMLLGRQIKNSLGKDVLLGSDYLGNTVMPGGRLFAITYKNLSHEECVDLATFPFAEKVIITIDNMQIINDKVSTFSWGSENALPISKNAALKACGENNDILWNIYL